MKDNGIIRISETGATRNTAIDKLDYEGFLSPIVIEAFAQYMHKHRHLADGTLRDSDNWQKLFSKDYKEHRDICIKSAWRHFMDLWMEHRGFESRDGMDEAICGLLFNIMAYYYSILLERREKIQNKIDATLIHKLN